MYVHLLPTVPCAHAHPPVNEMPASLLAANPSHSPSSYPTGHISPYTSKTQSLTFPFSLYLDLEE